MAKSRSPMALCGTHAHIANMDFRKRSSDRFGAIHQDIEAKKENPASHTVLIRLENTVWDGSPAYGLEPFVTTTDHGGLAKRLEARASPKRTGKAF